MFKKNRNMILYHGHGAIIFNKCSDGNIVYCGEAYT